jgi:hypothetical protein
MAGDHTMRRRQSQLLARGACKTTSIACFKSQEAAFMTTFPQTCYKATLDVAECAETVGWS